MLTDLREERADLAMQNEDMENTSEEEFETIRAEIASAVASLENKINQAARDIEMEIEETAQQVRS
jgi:hypothetical protein